VPGFAPATSNLNFTAVLAIIIFFIYNISGMRRNGPIHYFINVVPKGLPIVLLPLMAAMELLALFTRAFALAIRLFANMTAGHLMIACMVGLIAVFKNYWLAPPFVALTFFVYLIEILVAFLQAYIFTLLSCVFLGMSLNQEH
jgi:F-type H+-transporting ATPase subunit a